MNIISAVYNLLWGDLITIPLPGGGSAGLSLLVLILIPSGIYFTIRSRFLPVRLFPDMLKITLEKKTGKSSDAITGLQALIVSTATRVGMGNLVGVVAAISAGGAGAVFWMWVTALIGSSTAFMEATLAQLYKEKDPLYGGYRGGPAYYIQHYMQRKKGAGAPAKRSLLAILFALSGLVCWCGISQVISNSVSSAFENAFQIPPLLSTIVLVVLAAVIVLRKNATVKVLDIIVPIMAGCYFFITLFIIVKNLPLLPGVFGRIFSEAFGLRQAAAGSLGTVIMNGVKRGLFSNEAGMGSTPHAHAVAKVNHPVEQGFVAMIGVFIDTFVILNLTALVIITTHSIPTGETGAALSQYAFRTLYGKGGDIFIAICMFFFAFSTILGWYFFGQANVKYLFGSKAVKIYSVIVAVCVFLGSLAEVELVWTMQDTFNSLMVIPNILALFALSGVIKQVHDDYFKNRKK